MKKTFLILLLAAAFTMVGTSSCRSSADANCPAYSDAKVKTSKKGKLPTRRGRTNLFPKKMRKN